MSLAARRRRWLVLAGLLLLALLAIIAGVVLTDRAANAPLGLIPRDPLQVVIQRPGRTDILLDRAPGRAGTHEDWRISAPCALAADQRRLSPLFEALGGGGAHYPLDEVDLPGAGLEPPLATLRVDGELLHIGDADLSGTRRYVATAGRVHLVPEWLWALVNGGLSALASAEVFERTVAAIDQAVDQSVDPAVGLDVDDIARWNALQSTQIVAWPLVDAAADGSEPRRYRLDVTFEDGERTGVELFVTGRFEALVRDGAGCAHLLAPGTLVPIPNVDGPGVDGPGAATPQIDTPTPARPDMPSDSPLD